MNEIEHKYYGSGVIQKRRYGGFELLVQFRSGMTRWLRRDEVSLHGEEILQPKHKLYVDRIPEDQFLARKAVEALRLGIVPHDSIESFTIGRDREIAQFKKWLSSNKGTLYIRGEYGSGKSHLLDYIHSWALNNNWAVALVEVGLDENPFHKPYQIYQSLVQSFKCPSNGNLIGFREALRRIVNLADADTFKEHIYFRELISRFKELEELSEEKVETVQKTSQRGRKRRRKAFDENSIWEWIEAEYNWFKPSLSRTGTSANLYCNIINAISFAVKNILNTNGLLLLFDEAEYLEESPYKYQYIQGANFINGLKSLTNNKKTLITEKISLKKKRGYQTGYIYCGYPRNNPVRYAWQFPSDLKVVFAMTPIQEYKETIDLRQLKKDDLLSIAYNVVQFYKNAYLVEFEDEIVNILFKKLHRNKTRLFIKYIIEALDILRFNPQKSITDII